MSDNPEEVAYYLRFMSFFIDVTTETVLKVLYCTKQDISKFLQSSDTKEILLKLLKDKVLAKRQYYLVSAPVPNPEKFDLSLLITLLFSTGLSTPPKRGFGNRPGQSDLSLSADILRLRNIRNNLVGHRTKAALDKANFERLWKGLEEVLLRIHIKIAPGTEGELIEKIEYYRSRSLDACNGQGYLQKLEEWWENCEVISKLQEQVEDLIKKCNEFVLFFKDRPEKYSRYVRLLFEGGRLVLSNVLTKQISKQRYDLHTILLEKRDVLESRIANQEMFKQIFFTDSTDTVLVNTDIDSWDILVLVHVIETLNAKNLKVIRIIKDERINNVDTALMSLHDDDRFTCCCEDLVSSIRALSYSLDEDIQNICEEQIDKYRSTSSAAITTESDEYLHQLKSHGIGIKNLSNLYQETLDKLKKCVKEMEDAGICFKNDQVLELKMVTLGNSSERKKLAEDILETVWQAALRRCKTPDKLEAVRLEVDKILEEILNTPDVKATDIKRQCLLFSLICSSCQGLARTLDYLTSERFEEHVAVLSRELEYICEGVIRIEGHITFESLHKLLDDPDNCTEDRNGGLKLPIICSSPGGMRRVLELLGSEKTTNSFKQISDGLSLQVQDTISLQLLPDPMGFTSEFDETDNETTSSSDSHVEEVEYSDRYLTNQNNNLAGTDLKNIPVEVDSIQEKDELLGTDVRSVREMNEDKTELSVVMQLQSIPCNPDTLATVHLSDDIDIKDNIPCLIREARTLSNTFTDVMRNEGNTVLYNKNALLEVQNPKHVDIEDLKGSLRALQNRLQEIRDAMSVLQGSVHVRIEVCRARSQEHKETVELKKIEMQHLRENISILEKRINVCVADVAYEERCADNNERKARELEDKKEKHEEAGVVGSILMLGAGFIAAPVLGEPGLALACAAGNLSGNLNYASKCEDKARHHSEKADEKRQEAERHKQTRRSLESDIACKEKEIRLTDQRNDKMNVACKQLNEIEQQLYKAICITNAVTKNVQDLDTTLYETERQGNAFKIIQSAFGKNPEQFEGRAVHYLNELKEKWERVESALEQAQERLPIRKQFIRNESCDCRCESNENINDSDEN